MNGFIQEGFDILKGRARHDAIAACDAHASILTVKRIDQVAYFRPHADRIGLLQNVLDIHTSQKRQLAAKITGNGGLIHGGFLNWMEG